MRHRRPPPARIPRNPFSIFFPTSPLRNRRCVSRAKASRAAARSLGVKPNASLGVARAGQSLCLASALGCVWNRVRRPRVRKLCATFELLRGEYCKPSLPWAVARTDQFQERRI
jgi:hypothetical protein